MTTRKDIRQRIGRVGFAGDMVVSTASATGAAAGATLIDTKLPNRDDTFNGDQIAIVSGTSIGDYRWITDYVASTGTITPDRAFTAQIASAVEYEIHTVFSGEDKNEAIKAAMQEAGMRWPREIEDTSLSFTVNTYTYSLDLTVDPDQIARLDEVLYDTGASGTGYPYAPLPRGLWDIRVSGSTYTLQLHQNANAIIPSGKTIRLVFRVRPSVLTDDTTALLPDNDGFIKYICCKATAFLYDKRAKLAREQGTRNSHWKVQADSFHAQALLVYSADQGEPQYGDVIMSPEKQHTYIERDVSKIHIP